MEQQLVVCHESGTAHTQRLEVFIVCKRAFDESRRTIAVKNNIAAAILHRFYIFLTLTSYNQITSDTSKNGLCSEL